LPRRARPDQRGETQRVIDRGTGASFLSGDDYYSRLKPNPEPAKSVAHPREYQCCGYAVDGGGKASESLKPHALYLAPGSGTTGRGEAYPAVFRAELDPQDAARIRTGVDPGIGVGDARFLEGLVAAEQTGKKVDPL
jgi:hypothetical protein